ncbi:hypothetical protein OZ411_24010 [Bradyrhizobium sp. Arg237L]|uniref:hypothetical protein n=1 Tax=Bradyrhizobium sp. Arg237L TaxID=3003352 RepID=UPI00249E391D|nr:hypothetical protein [Bradyrhizobium sp. Arg237L]MDI4235880.1 hypothetical protein [Bradyrhizobium sp. Arg237L]
MRRHDKSPLSQVPEINWFHRHRDHIAAPRTRRGCQDNLYPAWQPRHISPTIFKGFRKAMNQGIQQVVGAYVRLKNVTALLEMKAHRKELLSRALDTDQFSLALSRDLCRQDLAAIEDGIQDILKGGTLRGYVDHIEPHTIAGWAQCVDHPEIPLRVELYFDGRLVGSVLADRYRQDLENANLGSGNHSFQFKPDRHAFLAAELIAVAAPDGKLLHGGTLKRTTAASVDQPQPALNPSP